MKSTAVIAALLALAQDTAAFAPPMPRSSVGTNLMAKPKPIVDAEILSKEALSQPKSTDPTPVLVSAFQDNNVLKAAALATALAVTLAPQPSDAAMTGGRMGGSFARPPPMVRSMPSASRGYSSYSPYRSSFMSRPNVIIAPSIAPAMPLAPVMPLAPSPFFFPRFSLFPGFGMFGLIGPLFMLSLLSSTFNFFSNIGRRDRDEYW